MGLFSSGKSKVEFKESAQSAAANKRLKALGEESVAFPTRQIADLTDTELEVERQAIERLETGPSELTQRGLDLTAAAAEQTDPLQDPTIKSLIAEATRIGQEETGRVGRSVQIRGGLGSTTGRDVLGRSVGQTQERIIAAASPLISQKLGITERARTNLIGAEEGLETNRLSLGSAVGGLRRRIKQAKFDADIEKFITDINFRFGAQANVLKGQIDKTPVVSGGDPSLFSQAAPILGAAALGLATGGFGLAGGTGIGAGGAFAPAGLTTSPLFGTAAQNFAVASDKRIKENIVPIENALEKLMQLEGFTFTMKDGGEKKAGIMAQDLEKVLPDAVFEIDGVKHIKLDAVLGLIVSAIKEMN